MDFDLHSILSNHFVWGLILGLLIWLFTIIKCLLSMRSIKKNYNRQLKNMNTEKNKIKQHLQTQLEIEADSKEAQKKNLQSLKDEIENLRGMVQTLKQTPKKEEMLLLQIYDRAIHLMHERAPGFAPTWEVTLREAQEEQEKARKGLIPFIKRIVRPSAYTIEKNVHYKQLDSGSSEGKGFLNN
ncbi:MAG: hypothetical protein GY756_18900 [bacterium]|nr:hypothetical protein [bacterium]